MQGFNMTDIPDAHIKEIEQLTELLKEVIDSREICEQHPQNILVALMRVLSHYMSKNYGYDGALELLPIFMKNVLNRVLLFHEQIKATDCQSDAD